MRIVFHDGMFTFSVLTEQEAKQYMDMPIGLYVAKDMICSVADNEEERSVFELTGSALNHIQIKKVKDK